MDTTNSTPLPRPPLPESLCLSLMSCILYLLNGSNVRFAGGLLKLKYVTGYVMTQQVAAVRTSGWCVRQKENVFLSLGYLRNREREVVCDRVGMGQYTLCWYKVPYWQHCWKATVFSASPSPLLPSPLLLLLFFFTSFHLLSAILSSPFIILFPCLLPILTPTVYLLILFP